MKNAFHSQTTESVFYDDKLKIYQLSMNFITLNKLKY